MTCKPLIEMSVDVRLLMHAHLPKLVLAIGRQADPTVEQALQEEQTKRDLEAAEAMLRWDEQTAARNKARSKQA